MENKWPKNRISDIRLSLNYKQGDFGKLIAEKVNRKSPYSYATVSYWETNSDTIPLEVMYAICNIAHCTIDYLLGFSDSPFQIENCNDDIDALDGKCIIAFTNRYSETGCIGLVNAQKRVIIFKNGYELSFDDLACINLYKYSSSMEVVQQKQLLKYNKKQRPVYALTISEEQSSPSDGWYYYDINLGCCINDKKDCLYLNDYYHTWIAVI